MSSIASSAGIASRDTACARCGASSDGRDDVRPMGSSSFVAGAGEEVLRHVDAVRLDERLAHLEPHRLEERVRHRAADHERGRRCGSSCSMTSILSEIFAPPRTATNGRFGFVERRAEVVELPLPSGARRPPACRQCAMPFGRRVRAVRGPERVVHVEVAELGELRGRRPRRSFPRRRGSAVFSSTHDARARDRASPSPLRRCPWTRRTPRAAPAAARRAGARPARASTSPRACPSAGRGARAARRARRGRAAPGSSAARRGCACRR